MPRCRYGRNCRYHAQGSCRFYHSPSPSPSPSRSRSRSRDRFNNSNNNSNNNNRNNARNNLTLNMQSESKQEDNISNQNVNTLQFMSHRETEDWGEMNIIQTTEGLEMSPTSLFPTRIGRCKLISGKYYYEVHLKSTPCNARIGWGKHSQNIDVKQGRRIGEDDKGWAYNGWSKAHTFWNGKQFNYGDQWIGSGDVVSCAIDIDKNKMRFYLNGNDLGIAFSNFSVGTKGIAPCISVSTAPASKILVVTEKSKFKYKIPNGYSSIQ
eukprot:139155_1